MFLVYIEYEIRCEHYIFYYGNIENNNNSFLSTKTLNTTKYFRHKWFHICFFQISLSLYCFSISFLFCIYFDNISNIIVVAPKIITQIEIFVWSIITLSLFYLFNNFFYVCTILLEIVVYPRTYNLSSRWSTWKWTRWGTRYHKKGRADEVKKMFHLKIISWHLYLTGISNATQFNVLLLIFLCFINI